MAETTDTHLIIVGAGFSAAAGLPLASQFTAELLNGFRLWRTADNVPLIELLQSFVRDTFGGGGEVDPDDWPELEDIFTSIDLAANSGHNLGPDYPPVRLRTVRRALIARTIRMLDRAYKRGARQPDERRNFLTSFLGSVPAARTAFLSMNWDTVIEAARADSAIDYGCDARPARFVGQTVEVIDQADMSAPMVILKPHGSINWMYCDSCSGLFWFAHQQVPHVARRLFGVRDRAIVADIIGTTMKATSPPRCPECHAEALGTRLATFSYRKALDFPIHGATWRATERQLRMAASWTFIGYSMPAADYEFKHLLKRVHLSRPTPPIITVVTGGSEEAAKATERTYRKFLGDHAIGKVFENGVDQAVIDHLRELGVIV